MLSSKQSVNGDNIYWVDFLSSEQIIKVLRSYFSRGSKLLNNKCMLENYWAQFRIEYKQRTSNKVAISLSRLPDNLSKLEPTLQSINSESAASFLT